MKIINKIMDRKVTFIVTMAFILSAILYWVYFYNTDSGGPFGGYWSIEECINNAGNSTRCNKTHDLSPRYIFQDAQESLKSEMLGYYPDAMQDFSWTNNMKKKEFNSFITKLNFGSKKNYFITTFADSNPRLLDPDKDLVIDTGKGYKVDVDFRYENGLDAYIQAEFNKKDELARVFISGLDNELIKDIKTSLGKPEFIYKPSPTIFAFDEYVYASKGITIIQDSAEHAEYVIVYKPIDFDTYRKNYRETFIRGYYK